MIICYDTVVVFMEKKIIYINFVKEIEFSKIEIKRYTYWFSA